MDRMTTSGAGRLETTAGRSGEASQATRRRSPNPARRAVLAAGLVGALAVGAVACGGDTAPTAGKAGGRVDLKVPTFSNPLNITNPLFPKGPKQLSQTVELGDEPDTKLRFEVTQLDRTRKITWQGKEIETAVTHFVAYHNGRLVETAYDYYAQGDDGSVWYFGEDVNNYEDGALKDHDGTWLAGKDGPPGMIMPGKPKVGDVYRPENIPKLVFEEATVQAVDLTVPGPRGEVKGAIRIQAKLLDGTVEQKIYAPGYGEFRAEVTSAKELYFLALGAPTDNANKPMPAQLAGIVSGANQVFGDAGGDKWPPAAKAAASLTGLWKTYTGGDQVPELLKKQVDDALGALDKAITAKDSEAARQAAIDVSHAILDLHLRYRGQDEVDVDRLAVWGKQLQLDTASGNKGDIAGDQVAIAFLKERINK